MLIEKVRNTIQKYSMLKGGEKVLVGLSGGPDSVTLLEVLYRLREELGLALCSIYVDHGLRPDETPAEIAFAKRISEERGIGHFVEKIDVRAYAESEKLGKQEAARILRYEAYEKVLNQTGAGRIALGHNADDQIETFFMRLLRGSGAKGLTSIPAVRGKIIRPLIETERADIEDFIRAEGLDYIVDSSNLKTDYTRNRLRQSLVPRLREFNPNLTSTIQRTIEILNDEERYFDTTVLKALMRLIPKKTDTEIELFVTPLESMDRVILRRVLRKAIELTKGLRALDFKHIEELIALVKTGRPGARLYLPGGVRAIKKYSTIIITSGAPAAIGTHELPCPGKIRLPETGAVIEAKVVDSPVEGCNGRRCALVDAEKIKRPLFVRARRKGDFFYPAGFGKRKKLQDLFVDAKIPRDERDAVPIIENAGGEIVWVAGLRADERFKAAENTANILMLSIG